MSDPVTNVEIEDVLSSIRKLVSADDRPAKKAIEASEGQVDKLVLTPALRVDEQAPLAVETPVGQNQDAASAADSDTQAGSTEDQAADAAHAADHADYDDVADGRDVFFDAAGEDGRDHGGVDRDAVQRADETSRDDPIEDAEVIEDSGKDEPGPDAAWRGFDDDAPDSVLTARVAELEKVVAARDDGWEPDGSVPDENAAEPTVALPWQDHMPGAVGAAEAIDTGDDTGDMDPVSADDPARDPFMSMTADVDDIGYEEDDVPSDPDPTAAATGGPTNAFLSDEDLLDDGAEAILDEETLRDLVAEIVRQELQGSLGERITRNVRKLVRREIQRALAAQDLE